MNVTDRRMTDGRAIAYSERERQFTFANSRSRSLKRRNLTQAEHSPRSKSGGTFPIQSNVMLRAQEFLSARISNNIALNTNSEF